MKKVISALLSILTVMSMFVFSTTASATYYESESNDTRETTNVVSLDEEVIGELASSDDTDWFQVAISQSGLYEIVFSVDRDAYAEWKIALYKTNASGEIVHERTCTAYGRSISFNSIGLEGMSFYIKITGNYAAGWKMYQLETMLFEGNADYYEIESNDSKETADYIKTFSRADGVLCGTDDSDWFRVCIPISGVFTIAFSVEKDAYAEWNVSLYRVAPSGEIVHEKTGTAYGRSISFQSISSGNVEYFIKITGNYAANWEVYSLTATHDIPTPDSFRATQTTKSVKLNWSRVNGVTGYVLYRYSPNTKKYKKVAQLGKNATSYTVSNLKSGTEYTYAIRSYYKANGKNYFSAYKHLTTATKPNAPEIRAVSTGNRKVALSWSKSAGATYYQVYMATDYYGKYKRISTTDARKLVKKGLSRGQTYYFKVRSYKVFDGGKVYSAFSDIRSANV